MEDKGLGLLMKRLDMTKRKFLKPVDSRQNSLEIDIGLMV